MSVPSWRRKLSKTEYLFQTFQLCKYVGRIVANMPKKYGASYGDILIQTTMEALKLGQTANGIFINDTASFQLRRASLLKMHGCIDHVSTCAYIYLETARANDQIKTEKRDKMYEWENVIGTTCEEINRMIKGVMKSDHELLKKIEGKQPKG